MHIYITIIIWIIVITLNLASEKIEKISYFLIALMLILSLVHIQIDNTQIEEKEQYIQTLETKVNILEKDYIDFTVEDSKKQEG